MKAFLGLLQLLLVLQSFCWQGVWADWGDYADHSFQCPVLTTCGAVCVANVSECPFNLTCTDPTEVLCDNGRACVQDLKDCPDDDNPCADNPCDKVVPCKRVNMYLDDCETEFHEYYDDMYNCGYIEPRGGRGQAETHNGEKISWTTSGHLFFYVWICVVTFLLLAWCAYNQRFCPVGQAVPLHDFSMGGRRRSSYSSLEGSSEPVLWTQTGYKTSKVGSFIYFLVMVTLLGFHALLAAVTAFYYAQQRGHGPAYPYKNDIQVLYAFELTWTISFVWTLALKWPASIEALFLRRCLLSEATHVAVFAPMAHTVRKNKDAASQSEYINRIKEKTNTFFKWLDRIFAFIFSEVHRPNVPGRYYFHKVDEERSFSFRLRRYNWDEVTETFMPGMMTIGHSVEDMLRHKGGLTSEEVEERRRVVGKNVIPMEKPTVLSVTLAEGSKIFYVYQIYIIWWWFNFWYYHMGIIYLGMFILGGVTTVYVTYMNEAKLYKLGEVDGDARVLRDEEWKTVAQVDLVPGDIVSVEPGKCFCDMVIFEAGTILVDESGITGEATPVSKTAVDAAAISALYSVKEHKKNTISAGTIILETGEGDQEAKAVVTQTGSFTAKGNLLRDILFYERHQFKFDTEIKLVFFILILYGVLGFVLTVSFLNESEVAYAIFYGMYVVETAIPPLIPTVFLVSVGISAERLLWKRIACADNREILVTGKVSHCFFDKTGTLTNQGLDYIRSLVFLNGEQTSAPEQLSIMERGMAVCHTLTKSSDGTFVGTFIDQVMFKSSQLEPSMSSSRDDGQLVITTNDGATLKILKRFEFDHSTMTQSVIVEDEDGKIRSYVKGSAENIQLLCRKESLPNNFSKLSENASREGIYQISLACGEPPAPQMGDTGVPSYASMSRSEVERDLVFVGFMDFKNTLRKETPDTIKHLKDGSVKCTMVTGDSLFTGIKIARDSCFFNEDARVVLGRSTDDKGVDGVIIQWVDSVTDEPVPLPTVTELAQSTQSVVLAVTGSVWQTMLSRDPDQAHSLAPYIKVFGRCTPNDKVSVVLHFVKRGCITCMVGDGGNDCGALKTAHVGIALSDSEASIVSPFTSLDKSIESVVEVLREGRCCLASAFSSYKFMIMYGQLETTLQITAAWYAVGYAEWNWVWLDGILAVPLAFTLPLSSAADRLGPTRPTASLLGPHTMASTLGVLFINLLCLITSLVVLTQQDWYQCRKWESTDISFILALGDNYESNVTFLMTSHQYVISAIAFNFGFTYRKHWCKNYLLVFLILIFTFIHYYITLVPGRLSCFFRMNCSNDDNKAHSVYAMGPVPIQNPYNSTLMPEDFRNFLALLITANLFAVLGWEYYVVGQGYGKKIWRAMFGGDFNEEPPAIEKQVYTLETKSQDSKDE